MTGNINYEYHCKVAEIRTIKVGGTGLSSTQSKTNLWRKMKKAMARIMEIVRRKMAMMMTMMKANNREKKENDAESVEITSTQTITST